MDGTKFDEITQDLAENASRRRLVAGLLGGAALLTGVGIAAAKKGKGKAKGKGNGGNGKGKKHGHNKVAICHKVGDNEFVLKFVPTPALKGHREHDDIVCGEPGTCQTDDPACDATTGACTFANAADGSVCTDDLGAAGTCLAGVCVV